MRPDATLCHLYPSRSSRPCCIRLAYQRDTSRPNNSDVVQLIITYSRFWKVPAHLRPSAVGVPCKLNWKTRSPALWTFLFVVQSISMPC